MRACRTHHDTVSRHHRRPYEVLRKPAIGHLDGLEVHLKEARRTKDPDGNILCFGGRPAAG